MRTASVVMGRPLPQSFPEILVVQGDHLTPNTLAAPFRPAVRRTHSLSVPAAASAVRARMEFVRSTDAIKARVVGNLIRCARTAYKIDQVTDNSFTSSNQGIVAYVEKTTGVKADYRFTSFMASDPSIQR